MGDKRLVLLTWRAQFLGRHVQHAEMQVQRGEKLDLLLQHLLVQRFALLVLSLAHCKQLHFAKLVDAIEAARRLACAA